jgi:hypothetical protein
MIIWEALDGAVKAVELAQLALSEVVMSQVFAVWLLL